MGVRLQMTWWIRPLEIVRNGTSTGRWRLTATSDEGGGGPWGDDSHDHDSAEEAVECSECDRYCSSVAGFPSKEEMARQAQDRDRKEFARLKKKFGEA